MRIRSPSPRVTAFAIVVALACASARAHAQATGDVEQARRLFVDGTQSVQHAEWAKALASFEKSAAIHPHAITTYNIAQCQRAMGRYTRARASFRAALEQGAAGELPTSLADDAKGYLQELDRVFARVRISVTPADAGIAVDGAPLAVDPSDGAGRVVAGMEPAGPGKPAQSPRFELLVDPGVHIFVLSRKGFKDVVVQRTFAASSTSSLDLTLDRLPAVLRIASNREGAVVTVGGLDVGVAPVDVTRPAGSYRVVVKKQGFASYESDVVLKPGEETTLRAALVEQSTPLTKRWWFWTAAVVVVGGAAVGTYFATRPAPTRPSPDGGGLGWTVPIR